MKIEKVKSIECPNCRTDNAQSMLSSRRGEVSITIDCDSCKKHMLVKLKGFVSISNGQHRNYTRNLFLPKVYRKKE